MKKEDENLKKAINEFLEGNTSSFDDIYKFSSKYVYTCISKIVKDEELIKDIMQETYIEVIKNIDKLKNIEVFKQWAGKIAVNKTKRYLIKDNKIDLEYDEDAYDVEEEREIFLPENIIEDKETQNYIKNIINLLSNVQKMVIIDYYFNDMKVDEISKKLEMPSGTIKTHLHRARKKIKLEVSNLESKGVKLYSSSIGVILIFLFMQDVEEAKVPKEIYDEVSKNINNSPEFSKLKNNNRNTLLNKEPLNKSIIQDIKTKFYLVGKASALKFIIPIILSGAVFSTILVVTNNLKNYSEKDNVVLETNTINTKNENDKKDDVLIETPTITLVEDKEKDATYLDENKSDSVVINETITTNKDNSQRDDKSKIVEVYFSKDTNNKLNEAINLVNEEDLDKVMKALNICYELHNIISPEEATKHIEKDQFDYIFFNGIDRIIKETENNQDLREKYLIDITDSIYLSTARRFNAFKAEDTFLYKYSLYITDENKKYISNDENYNKMLRGTTLTESLYKYKIGEIEAVADETQKPSKIN
ncbi:MAG: sigma-70 family RNA polymerase sigma factor [Clostridium sp.]